jgi:S-DNA-T family DNA segregation ATPase FtsK/SpoIIIE
VARKKRVTSRKPAAGVALLVAGLILTVSFLPRATGVAITLGRWQRLFLGDAAPLLPAFMVAGGLYLLAAGSQARFTRRIIAVISLSLAGIAAYHTRIAPGAEFAAVRADFGSGVTGAALVWLLRTFLGEIGMWLVISLAVGASVALGSGISLSEFRDFLARLASATSWLGTTGFRYVGRRIVAGVASLLGLIWASGAAIAAGFARVVHTVGARLVRQAAVPLTEPPISSTPVLSASVRQPSAPAVVEEPPRPESVAPSFRAGEAKAERPQVTPESPKADTKQESLKLELPSGGYQLPAVSMLTDLPGLRGKGKTEPSEVARALEQTLASFGVEAKVVRWEQGPVVTRFEVQPAPGVRVQKISSLTNDIALGLAAPSVRIEAPIPGKSAVGIELPNQKTSLVHIKEILASEEYQRAATPLTVAIGKDIAGHPILADLAEMPHVLIAGATGSGKSVMLNAIIAGLLFRCTPLDARLLMIDPKRVEFTNYNNIPHLLVPVVTNPRAAAGALKQMLAEMEERFERFASSGVRNIQAYNQLDDVERLPFIVIVIDELADLMMVAPADFEDVIVRLCQMTRATGIHLVVATQRPSVDVITGLIKANIPSRIAFAVSSQVDSRTILDMPGAEKLLGKGDMLFMPIAAPRPVRAQGAFIADSEVQALVNWWKSQGKPVYDQKLVHAEKSSAEGQSDEDDLLVEAARLIVRSGYGSVSLLQRKMKIGYVRAARIVDQLEEKGIVGPTQGSNPREVLIGIDELERLLGAKARSSTE